MKSVLVFYEDKRGQAQAEFTLHELVRACVRSRLAVENKKDLEKRLRAVTPKGVNEVLKRFKDLENGRGEERVALVDRDRIAEHLPNPLPRTACRQQIFQSLLGTNTPRKAPLTIVLFENNLEDLLRHIGASPHFPSSLRSHLTSAIEKGRNALMARDLVLHEARTNEGLRQHAAAFPSMSRLVANLVALLEQEA
jgi:hypothetical protein